MGLAARIVSAIDHLLTTRPDLRAGYERRLADRARVHELIGHPVDTETWEAACVEVVHDLLATGQLRHEYVAGRLHGIVKAIDNMTDLSAQT